MKSHPFADAFPMLPADELAELASDIKAHGLQHPVILFQGQVLDGRNRLAACTQASVEPEFEEFEGTETEARALVWSLNSARRHLTPTQKGCAWSVLFPPVDLRGSNNTPGIKNGASRSETPRDVSLEPQVRSPDGVSPKTVDRCRAVQKAAPAVFEAMRSGLIDAKPAERLVKLKPAKQEQVIEAIKAGVKPTQAMRQVSREHIRETNAAQELQGKYSLIYADPPWQYGNTGLTGAAEDHYPTMDTAAICRLPVAEHVTDNAVLLLWVTNPLLPDGLEVCRAWGFEYKTQYVWVKNRGTPAGFHVRSRTEMLWVCTRGQGMTIDPDKLPDNVIDAPVTKHSRKPPEVYELLESLYPHTRKLEMFCRQPREGWEAFGNEI